MGTAAEDDIRAIEALKYRYLRCFDTKDWDGFAETMTPDVTGAYAGLEFADRDALVGYMREHVGADVVTMHQVHHPEIELDGDTGGIATGRWYLQDKVIATAYDVVIEGAAFYEDRYVRTPAGWRIAHTGYQRTWEATYSLADLPSWQLKHPGQG